MQIYCPKCNACYEIDEHLIADKSRRVKCSACGEIFTAESLKTAAPESVRPEAELPEEDIFAAIGAAMAEADSIKSGEPEKHEETPPSVEETVIDTKQDELSVFAGRDLGDGRIEPSFSDDAATSETEESLVEETAGEEEDDNTADLEKIFERLSEHTEHLIAAEKKLPVHEKVWLQIKNALGFHFKVKWSYLVAGLAVFVLLSLYNNRYQIVRELPFLNGFYKTFGIKAKIPGEGLEFQNVSWDFVKDDDGSRLIVKGFVYNLTDRGISLPVVHIEILDKQTALLQSQNRELKETEIDPNTKIPLNLVLSNPAPTAKYVYLTFIDKD